MMSVIGQATCQLRETKHATFATLNLLNKEAPSPVYTMRAARKSCPDESSPQKTHTAKATPEKKAAPYDVIVKPSSPTLINPSLFNPARTFCTLSGDSPSISANAASETVFLRKSTFRTALRTCLSEPSNGD